MTRAFMAAMLLAVPAARALPTADILSAEGIESAGGVRVRWEAAADRGVVGYHVEWLDPAAGRFVRATRELVPCAYAADPATCEAALVGPPAGAPLTVRFVALRVNGAEAVSPSFALVPHAPAAAAPAAALPPPVASPAAAPGDRVKIGVEQAGIYFVSADTIAACLTGATAQAVADAIGAGQYRLSRGSNAIAWLAAPANTGIFFYAEAVDSIYTRRNVYWLDSGAGTTMAVRAGAPPPMAGEGGSFRERIHFEDDKANTYNDLIIADPEADIWFWASLYLPAINATTQDFRLFMPGVTNAGGGAELTAHMLGATAFPANPEHHARIFVNGGLVASNDWDDFAACDPFVAVTNLVDGTNLVSVEAYKWPGDPAGLVFLVDSFDVAYDRSYRAWSNSLVCTAGTNALVGIAGFASTNILVFDVTSPRAPVLVTDTLIDDAGADGFRVSFVPAAASNRYAATAAALAPAAVTGRPRTAWAGATNRADYVVFTPAALRAPAEALADYRRAQGLTSVVVDVEDVFDEFNGGLFSPHAFRPMVAAMLRHWAQPPRFVVLAGAGNIDYRNVNNNATLDPCFIPPLTIATPDGLVGADNPMADVDGDHVPDVALGRLPVINTNEFYGLIAKMLAYEAGVTNPPNVLFVADNPDDAGNFTASSDALAGRVPALYALDRNYLATQTTAQVRSRLFATLNAGCALVNYVGHGNIGNWAAENILSTADVTAFTNQATAPFVTALTCLFGRFDRPSSSGGLAERLIRRAQGGFGAVWSCAAYAENDANTRIGDWMLRACFRVNGRRIGAAAREALAAYAAGGGAAYVLDAYDLLGDPALDAGLRNGEPLTFAEWQALMFTTEERADPLIGGPDADPDGDGQSNMQEFLAGTLPKDGQSVLRITEILAPDDGTRAVHWPSAANRIYAVDFTTNLVDTPFAEAARGLWAEPPLNGFWDTAPRGADTVFYRIRLEP